MYQALYRKYRPKSFEDVVGQDIIVKTLKNSIKNNIVTHAYLFSGPRGTGKTSIAKIFAKILNCQDLNGLEPCNKCISCEQANKNQNIDIIEIDAASNNGVDEIREIRNKITLVPTNSKYKVYIIDEVHMLTNQAFNALLKTLEEPPSHIIFIFATTEPHKIPKTILSRCQRFDYKRVSVNKIVERLKYIAHEEQINVTDEALYEIAKLSDGGMRDSISLLDQALAYCDTEITINDIHDINGTLLPEEIEELIIKMLEKDLVCVMNLLEKYDDQGKNFVKIVQEIIDKLKDCLIFKNAPELMEKNDFYNKIMEINNFKDIYTHIKTLSMLINELKNINNSKLLLEIELIKNMSISEIYVDNLEKNEFKIEYKSKKEARSCEHISQTKEECAKVENTKENKVNNTIDKEKLSTLKSMRIKNSLHKFSQKEREKIKEKLDELNDYLSDTEYAKYVSLIKDGELKAVSDNYLMFMYKTELMAESFNLDISKIEELLEKCFYETYRVIAIDFNDWNYIKEDYNKNREKYVYIDDMELVKELFNKKNNEEFVKNNSIDDMFNDIIEYR